MVKPASFAAATMFILALASCDRGPLHRVRLFEEPPPGPAIMVFYLDRDLEEGALRDLVTAEAGAMKAAHPYVEAYVFYDKSFAKRFGSDETMRRILERGATPGSEILFDTELALQGGAFLAISPENPLGAWAFYEREPNPAP